MMGLLDSLAFSPDYYSGDGGLLGRLRQAASYQAPVQNEAAQQDRPDSYMNVGSYRMPVYGQAQPAQDDASLPVNAQPTQGGNMATQNYSPQAAPSQAVGMQGVGNSILAGLEGFATNKGFLPALAGMVKGFADGETPENQTIKVLTRRGIDAETAKTVARDPALLRSFLQQNMGIGGDFSKTPIYGRDAQGNPVIMQLGQHGGLKVADTPKGVTISTGIEKIDAGTHWIVNDKRSGQVIGTVPKDLRGAEREKGIGEAQGKAVAAAPADIQAGQNALDLIGKIRSHPGLDWGTGFTAAANRIPGTQGYDFQNIVEQAKSGAFLSAIQQMRGLGSLSNAEGGAATAAVTRMNTSTTKKGFLDALSDYEKIVKQGIARAEGRLKDPSATVPAISAPAQNDPLGIR